MNGGEFSRDPLEITPLTVPPLTPQTCEGDRPPTIAQPEVPCSPVVNRGVKSTVLRANEAKNEVENEVVMTFEQKPGFFSVSPAQPCVVERKNHSLVSSPAPQVAPPQQMSSFPALML